MHHHPPHPGHWPPPGGHFPDSPAFDSPQGQTLRALLEATRRFHRLQMTRGPWSARHPLRPNEWFLLGRLAHLPAAEGIKPSELASQLGVTPASVTQLITGLEARGWVDRHGDASDRRAVRVRLTPQGREMLDSGRRAFIQAYSGLLAALGEAECLQLAGLLNKASDYFETAVPGAPDPKEEHPPC